MKRFFLLLIYFLVLASCASVPVGDTSQNALDWPGTYKCDKMTITLKANNTYKAQVKDVEVRSSFRWDRKGQVICLDHLVKDAPCRKFKVGENVLIPLNNTGRVKKDGQKLIKVSSE